MANQVDVQIIEEGYRNATARIAAQMDTSNVSLLPAFAVSQFVANDPNYTKLLGFRVDWLQYSVDPDIVVSVFWNSSAPQLIAAMSDSNDLKWRDVGGLKPNMLLTGFDGSINLTAIGFTPGNVSGFTISLGLVKLYQK